MLQMTSGINTHGVYFVGVILVGPLIFVGGESERKFHAKDSPGFYCSLLGVKREENRTREKQKKHGHSHEEEKGEVVTGEL